MDDILCFSTTDWDEIWGSRQQIMLRLAQRGYRVLFVERQVGPEHLWRNADLRRRKLSAWRGPALQQVAENLWRWQPPLLPPGRYYSKVLNEVGQHRLAEAVRRPLHELGIKQPILWLYPPQSTPLLGRFGERLSVYHCIERFAGDQTGRKRQVMVEQEQQLLTQADLVFTHSEGLRQLYNPLTRRAIVLLPSAADVQHYQSVEAIHPQLDGLPHPLLGMMGTLDSRIDTRLLETLARHRPDWHLVVIGRVRPGHADFSSLFALPNIHHLGHHPFSELPSLLNGLDLALIPYKLNGMTRFINPLKAYEYLAAGLPVVSVDLPEVRPLQEWVSIVVEMPTETMPQRFEAAIQKILAEQTPEQREKRRQAAWQHSWDRRVDQIEAHLEALLFEKTLENE